MNTKECIEEIQNNYLQEKNKPIKDNKFGRKIMHEIPEELYKELKLDRNRYLIEASYGKGSWVNIPWIAIFDKEITVTAQEGYYIVILFNADMSGFYLSLNQGYTWFKEKFKPQKAKEKIKYISDKLRTELKLEETSINLHDKGDLAKGYQLGNIYAKYYPREGEEKKQIREDIWNMLELYYKLKEKIGISWEEYNQKILNISNKSMSKEEKKEKEEQPTSTYNKEKFLSEIIMSDEQYETIITTIQRKKNIILEGVPGVGKTYCAKKILHDNRRNQQRKLIKNIWRINNAN